LIAKERRKPQASSIPQFHTANLDIVPKAKTAFSRKNPCAGWLAMHARSSPYPKSLTRPLHFAAGSQEPRQNLERSLAMRDADPSDEE
jgi:hypothetical protein